MPARWRKSVITSQGLFMAYALLQGFASTGVDNAAHVGGLATGALLAWLLADNLDEAPRGAQRGARALAGSLACVAAVAAFVVATPGPRVDHRKRFAAEATLKAAMPTLREGEDKLRQDARELAAGRLTQAQFAERLERVHLPAYRLLERQLAEVDFEPQDPRAEFTREFRNLTGKTVQAMELQVGIARGTLSRPTAVRDLAMTQQQITAIMRRLNEQAAQMAEPRH
jgi:rhomboid protease GluP